ncbi:MAG: retropepsin-like aspartic protease [Sedimenticolaceae bacterium]
MASAEIERRAAMLFRDGRFQQATEAYRTLLDRHPERLDVQARLGYLDLIANEPETAVTRLSTALENGYRKREVLSHLGEAYCRVGDLGPAALCFQQLGRDGLAGTLAAMADLAIMRLGAPLLGSDLAWISSDPLPVVRAEVNGVAANLVIDTGAGDCVLDSSFSVSAGVRLGGQEWRHFAGGQHAQVTHGHAEQLKLRDTLIHDVPVQVLDLQAVFGDWYHDLTIHGILGIRVMSLFDCALDYQAGLLSLQPPDDRRSMNEGVPIWLAENWMLLSHMDFPALGQALVFLDTGMTGGAFAVSATRAPDLGVDSGAHEPLVGVGGGGKIAGTGAHANALRLGSFERRNVKGLLLDSLSIESTLGFRINGLIGHDMLRDTRMHMDFANMRLHVSDASQNA